MVAANPGVVATSGTTGTSGSINVNISVSDATGLTDSTSIIVSRNFLTGYSLDFTNTTCTSSSGSGSGGGTTSGAIVPCAGGDTTAQLVAINDGNLVGDAQFTLEVVTGSMCFVNPIGSSTCTPTYTAASNHQGVVNAIIRVAASTPTQIGMIRVTHRRIGREHGICIHDHGPDGRRPHGDPDQLLLHRALSSQCGTGSGDFFVTGGIPPYSAVSSDANVTVVSDDHGQGRFTVSANNNQVCVSNATIVITDSGNTNPANRTTVTVTTTAGSGAPPPTAISASPSTLATLVCGQSASVIVVGGTGSYQAASSGPSTAVVAGNVVTITSNDNTNTNVITITDGTSAAAVTVPHCT